MKAPLVQCVFCSSPPSANHARELARVSPLFLDVELDGAARGRVQGRIAQGRDVFVNFAARGFAELKAPERLTQLFTQCGAELRDQSG